MSNLVDLDNLTDADVAAAEEAIEAFRRARAPELRREICRKAAAVSAVNRQARAAAGIKTTRRAPGMTKGALRQRGRKAAETRRLNNPTEPRVCEVCGAPHVANGLCGRHLKRWQRSGEDLATWKAERVHDKEPA